MKNRLCKWGMAALVAALTLPALALAAQTEPGQQSSTTAPAAAQRSGAKDRESGQEIERALAEALFAEESRGDLDGAIAAYQRVIAEHDLRRPHVAEAVFRLGEAYRKTGQIEKAQVQYARIPREFSDQVRLVELAQSRLHQKKTTTFGSVNQGSPIQSEERKIAASLLELGRRILLYASSNDDRLPSSIAEVTPGITGSPHLAGLVRKGDNAGPTPPLIYFRGTELLGDFRAGPALIIRPAPGAYASFVMMRDGSVQKLNKTADEVILDHISGLAKTFQDIQIDIFVTRLELLVQEQIKEAVESAGAKLRNFRVLPGDRSGWPENLEEITIHVVADRSLPGAVK